MVHILIVTAALIGVALVFLGVFVSGGQEIMDNAMTISLLEVTQFSVTDIGDTSRLSLTLKNSGNTPIANVSLQVINATNTVSNTITYSGTIESSRTHALQETLTISGTTNQMTLVDGSNVLIEITAETLEGATLNVDPLKIRVK